MNSANNPSASSLGTTPPTAPPPQGKSISEDLSESQFLHMQAANAKAAIKQTLSEIAGGLASGADPRLWTAEHPWIALTTAAVAGFAAGAVFIPSKEQQALKRLAEFERALGLRPTSRAAAEGNGDTEKTASGKPVKKGLLASMAGDLIKSIGPALGSALTAGMAAQGATGNATGANPPDQGGGFSGT